MKIRYYMPIQRNQNVQNHFGKGMPYDTIESGQLNKTAMGNGQINRYSTENQTDLTNA